MDVLPKPHILDLPGLVFNAILTEILSEAMETDGEAVEEDQRARNVIHPGGYSAAKTIATSLLDGSVLQFHHLF